MKRIIFNYILVFVLLSVGCARKNPVAPPNINSIHEGEWVCVDFDAPDISAWDDLSLEAMLGYEAIVKNGFINFEIFNKADNQLDKFSLKVLFPGKIVPIEESEFFDSTEKGTLDPKRFKFSDKVVEFTTLQKFQTADPRDSDEDFNPADFHKLKFKNKYIDFKYDATMKYTVDIDGGNEKMILTWDGGYFLYVPKDEVKDYKPDGSQEN